MGSNCIKPQEKEPRMEDSIRKGNTYTTLPTTTTSDTTLPKATLKLKLILLGDSGVGKTSLINQYVNNKFQNKPTIDSDELFKELEIDDKIAQLRILDTQGQEDRGLEAAFFNDAKGCMLVYDVTNPRSIENLKNWQNQFITRVRQSQSDGRSFPFVVLGNKFDLDTGKNRELNERVEQWCRSNGNIFHLLTSAKDNRNVVEAFQQIAKLAIDKEIRNVKLDQEKLKPYENGNNIKGSQGPVPQNPIPQKNDVLQRYHQGLVPQKFEGLGPQSLIHQGLVPQKFEGLAPQSLIPPNNGFASL